jgi:hypothetical protein
MSGGGKTVVTWDELRNALRNIYKEIGQSGLVGSGGAEASGIDSGAAYVMAGLTLTGLAASKPVFTNADKELVSTGTMPVDQGGTGIATFAVGDIIYASAAAVLSKLAKGSATDYLKGGDAPVWATLEQAAIAGLKSTDSPTFAGLTTTGKRHVALVVIDDNRTVQDEDEVIVVDSAVDKTVTLGAATGSKRILKIKNVNSGTVTIDGDGAETIDDEETQSVFQHESLQLVDYAAGKWAVL